MHLIAPKEETQLSAAEFTKLCTSQSTHLDLGCGDGKFILRLAREKQETLCIGIDADRTGLIEATKKAAKKPARGGAPNAKFVCANVLQLPTELESVATSVSVNFPWGSLLSAAAKPSPEFVSTLNRLLKPNCELSLYLNAHVFNDQSLRETLALPELTDEFIKDTLIAGYEAGGFTCQEWQRYSPDEEIPIRTTWGGRLTRNSGRPTVAITFLKSA